MNYIKFDAKMTMRELWQARIDALARYARLPDDATDADCDESRRISDEIDAEHAALQTRLLKRHQYRWRTDAASGTLIAANADLALAQIIDEAEWHPLDSKREQRDIANGAWLTIFDAHGVPVLRRGTMP